MKSNGKRNTIDLILQSFITYNWYIQYQKIKQGFSNLPNPFGKNNLWKCAMTKTKRIAANSSVLFAVM